VKAVTHLEVYRRFGGELRAHPLRFWPLLVAGIRVGVKKKLPLILYAPSLIGTIVVSGVVYLRFAAEEQLASEAVASAAGLQRMLAQRAMKLLEVRNLIIEFNQTISVFALLAVAWFGSGLLCEDRRVGAHQLYFARPLTRIDYFLGKLATVGFFGGLAMLVPGLVMCLVASYTSPNWSFLREEGDVVWRTIAYSAVWIAVTAPLVLCSSALFPRKSFALAGIFGFVMILHALGHILDELVGGSWVALSPFNNLEVISSTIFGVAHHSHASVATSWKVLVGVVVATVLVTGWRIRRLEVVA